MTGASHSVEIEDRSDKHEKYAYLAVCKCGWQGREHTLAKIDALANHHLNSQSYLAASGGMRLGGL